MPPANVGGRARRWARGSRTGSRCCSTCSARELKSPFWRPRQLVAPHHHHGRGVSELARQRDRGEHEHEAGRRASPMRDLRLAAAVGGGGLRVCRRNCSYRPDEGTDEYGGSSGAGRDPPAEAGGSSSSARNAPHLPLLPQAVVPLHRHEAHGASRLREGCGRGTGRTAEGRCVADRRRRARRARGPAPLEFDRAAVDQPMRPPSQNEHIHLSPRGSSSLFRGRAGIAIRSAM